MDTIVDCSVKGALFNKAKSVFMSVYC